MLPLRDAWTGAVVTDRPLSAAFHWKRTFRTDAIAVVAHSRQALPKPPRLDRHAIMRRRSSTSCFLLPIAAVTIVACSDFSPPKKADPAPIIGCYKAEGAPMLIVNTDSVTVGGLPQAVPFRYEQRRVGMVMNVPIAAQIVSGRPTFAKSDEHLLRVIFKDSEPVIRVAFGQQGYIYEYTRHTWAACAN